MMCLRQDTRQSQKSEIRKPELPSTDADALPVRLTDSFISGSLSCARLSVSYLLKAVVNIRSLVAAELVITEGVEVE